jgi:hypothetical protein
MKAPFGQTALQRHLAALESRLDIATGTRPLSFVAAARCFAVAGAVAAADALALFVRTGRRS